MSLHDLRWLTQEIKEIKLYHQRRISSLYAGQPSDEIIAIAGRMFGHYHGLAGTNDIDMLKEPDLWLDDVLSGMAEHANESADRVTFKPLVIEIDPLGVHYIDALFGARVYIHSGQVWSDELEYDLDELQMPDLSSSTLFQDSVNLVRKAVKVSQGHLFVTTPVLSCAINVGINIFGERLRIKVLPLISKNYHQKQ